MRLPGLVDAHVHVRDLGQAHKENWDTCTAAALAGGVTTILAMPNTQPAIVDEAALTAYEAAARQRARCDYGLYFGAGPVNVPSARSLAPRTAGLKLYLDATFGDLKLDGLDVLVGHAANWPADKPLLAHAEQQQTAAAIMAAHLAGRSIHIVHVARKAEIELIARAKDAGLAVTCEVCPHHLMLVAGGDPARQMAAVAGAYRPREGFAEVRPRLQTQADVDALWAHLDVIDIFTTDHAPHIVAEKQSTTPPPGFPGVELALPLWLTAAHLGLLDLDLIVDRMATAPRRLFNLPAEAETHIDVDLEHVWHPAHERQRTRAAWTPYAGWSLRGAVTSVHHRGRLAFDGERVLAPPGSGQNLVASPAG
jgi:carbamoyl-phosphate synthase/aspartate carbamoyltransferase/dihydroorotase